MAKDSKRTKTKTKPRRVTKDKKPTHLKKEAKSKPVKKTSRTNHVMKEKKPVCLPPKAQLHQKTGTPSSASSAASWSSAPSRNMHLERDVGGVPGLSILYEAFPEEVEQRLFALAHGDPKAPRAQGATAVHSQTPWKDSMDRRFTDFFWPPSWSDDFWRLINAARAGGLARDQIVMPNSVTGIAYPLGTRVGSHVDPVGYLGDAIIAVCLGSSGQMYLTESKTKGASKFVFELPRRCMYIFEGDARYKWVHGTLKLDRARDVPSWNPRGERRSLTFRTTVGWAKLVLSERIPCALGGGDGGTNDEVAVRLARMEAYEKREPKAKQVTTEARDRGYAEWLANEAPWQLSFDNGSARNTGIGSAQKKKC